MASGVRLCVVVLVCAAHIGPSFQNKFRANSKSKKINFETDQNSERQQIDLPKAEKCSISVLTSKNVPELCREDKGARPKERLLFNAGEEDEMLKGETVRDRLDSAKTDTDVFDAVAENVDPGFQHQELNVSKNKSSSSETNVKTRIKRSQQATEVSSLLPFEGTTERTDLLKSGSEDQEVAAGHKSHKWSKGGGHKYKKEHHKKGGHKGDKGYKTKHHHKKGEHEKHGKDEHKKHYKKQSGHKKKHHDAAEKYGEHHKKEKGHKGAKYGEKKGHKKGHKTKGYHHKFHKDEYKKEHKFYDDYHKKGHHDKHGHHHKHHAKKAGKHKKGGHHKSAYHKDKYGKKGHKEGGHYDQEHKGHKGKKGHKKYHENHSDYGKKGGHKEGKKWGYSKKHKHG